MHVIHVAMCLMRVYSDRARGVSSQVNEVHSIMQDNVGKLMDNNASVSTMQDKGCTFIQPLTFSWSRYNGRSRSANV